MDKEYFINVLKSRIAYLDEKEQNEYLDYYINEIDNKIKNGIDEYTAVKSLGAIIDIVNKIKNKESLEEVLSNDEVIETIEEEIKEAKYSKKTILLTSPIWVIAVLLVAIAMLAMYLISITLFSLGIVMFFTTFTSLTSPIPTIMFGLGTGIGLFGLAILAIPIAIFITNKIIPKYKYYFGILKECL